MITWAGRVIAIIGAGHLAVGLLLSHASFGDWLLLRLWGNWWNDTPPANAFWANPAGFGLPLALVGLLVVWMDRHGITPPAFLGWSVLAWSTVCAVVVEPTPAPLVVAAAVLLLRGISRAANNAQPHSSTRPSAEPPVERPVKVLGN
ncbi:DUF6463 family protein [Yinghuangia seranimata]|uniref:DUF6463 family protein n=1 Tax=Yinghuangia seranimata TaxID=408067 RepID=UPI00248B3DF2|nr:DUF6463 family protein [Yinghuangia seranimata]MDI2131070.1 DUF6463 family protein [Yinghuangia seranimata]